MQGRQHPSRDAQKLERLGKAVGDSLLKGVSCHVREGGACVIRTLKHLHEGNRPLARRDGNGRSGCCGDGACR